MSITKETKIEELVFPFSWRIIKAIKAHNDTVDKQNRLKTVKDITENFNELELKALLGVGTKTVKYFMEALNGTE